MSFHSCQSLSVNFFHVSLGLPAPGLPSICISHAVLIEPLDRSTCPNQRSKMRLRSSSFASSSLDLTLASSSGLIQLICLISDHGPIIASAAGSPWSVAKFNWHGAWSSAHKSCIHGHVSCLRGGRM